MRLRRLLGAAAVGVVSTAAANRALESSAGVLEPPLDGSYRTFRWRGIDVSYTEAGDRSAPTLVCLHGINAAGSSGEFREVFDDLADDYHVVAPDLPGFGCSDRPPLRYSGAFYEDFVAAFLARYDEPHVLASSLTAAYLLGALDGDDATASVASMCLVCPTAIAGPEPPKEWLCELFRAPLVGAALFNLLASKPSIRYFNADHGYYDTARVSAEWMEYEWRTAHQPNARFAPASFVSGFLNSDVDVGGALASVDVPATLVWGREADITPLSSGRDIAERGDARLVVFDDAMLLPHVEFPGQFVEQVRDAC
jgi:pimeloyl-ACP methyl ester carboxylesterase